MFIMNKYAKTRNNQNAKQQNNNNKNPNIQRNKSQSTKHKQQIVKPARNKI